MANAWNGVSDVFHKGGAGGYYGLGGGPLGIGGMFDAANSIFGLSDGPPAPAPPPDMPTLGNSVGSDGKLLDQYKLQGGDPLKFNSQLSNIWGKLDSASQFNKSPLQALEKYASSTGNSPWAQAMLDQNQNAMNDTLGKASATNNSAVTKSISDLAATGGATAGARERATQMGQKNLLDSTQGARYQGEQNALGIQANDAAQKLGVMGQLPGMEIAATAPGMNAAGAYASAATQDQAQHQDLDKYNQTYKTGVDQSNLSNALGGLNNYNQNALNIYGQQMAGYAANRTADAIQNAPQGKKGGGGGGKK